MYINIFSNIPLFSLGFIKQATHLYCNHYFHIHLLSANLIMFGFERIHTFKLYGYANELFEVYLNTSTHAQTAYLNEFQIFTLHSTSSPSPK